MYKTIAILGRQPKLGIAELESLYGADAVAPFGNNAALLTIDSSDIDFKRLGGTVRLARIVDTVNSGDWSTIERALMDYASNHAEAVDGKLTFGVSVFGGRASAKNVSTTALRLKKAMKANGQSVRMVPHKGLQLGSAVVLYNKLTSEKGWELSVVAHKDTAYIARTTHIQDIDAYAARDQARPMRDAKVGMLPPKLAQIIINLAVGRTTSSRPTLILDPFCGTGVTMQEAMLMDYDIYGSDIEPRMIEYTIGNLNWLDKLYPDVGDYRRIEVADAMRHTWTFPATHTIVVAGETFLGHPLKTLPESDFLRKIIHEANVINHKFLLNIARQLPSGSRLCVGVPTWKGKREFLHLPMLDHLTEMGYTRTRFKHASHEDLIYHRDNQIVGRELLVLEKV